MRNVTIIRTKAFAGSLGAFKVYIEDPLSGEVKINGTPCRKLGELKNGEECNFVVGDEAAKIYVINDLLTKNFYNDFYQLSEGTEDIVLSGKCSGSFIKGNVFRFDNNTDEAANKNRKKHNAWGIAIFVGAVVILSVVNILMDFNFVSKETFSGEGIAITLDDSFTEESYEGVTHCYSSEDAIIAIFKQPFSTQEHEAGLSQEAYAMEVMALTLAENRKSDYKLKTHGDLVYFDYIEEYSEDGSIYLCHFFIIKDEDAFWIVNITVMNEQADELNDEIFQWASSITLK